MVDKKDLLIKAGLLTELGTPIPELLVAMDEWADQQNKELKEIVLQLQKDFVLKLGEMGIELGRYIADNWKIEEDGKNVWWNPKTNKFCFSEELYFYYLTDKQSNQ